MVKDDQRTIETIAVTKRNPHLFLEWKRRLNSGRPNSQPREAETGHFFWKIFNDSLGIQLGLPLFFEASTADAKRSRLLKFLSYTW